MVYRYLNKDLGYTYQEISDFFKLPGRGGVAGCIRDIPAPVKETPKMDTVYPNVNFRACVFDLETTNFNAESNTDILTCMSYLPLDTDVVNTIAITHKEILSDDRDLAVLQRAIAKLSEFDIVIGHNIAAFDLNWLTTRLMYYNLPFPPSVLYYDTYSAVKRIGLRTWKNLGSLGAFFGLDGEKTKIFRPDWMDVLSNNPQKHKRAMAEIVYHCEQDVLMNRQLFNIVYPRDKRMRNLKYYDKWS